MVHRIEAKSGVENMSRFRAKRFAPVTQFPNGAFLPGLARLRLQIVSSHMQIVVCIPDSVKVPGQLGIHSCL